VFGEHVVGLLFAGQAPAFMPGYDLIRSGRHVGELEVSTLVSDGVVGMRSDEHFGVHPDMATVAAQIDQSRCGHGARSGAVGEREGQIERSRAVHVDGVKGRVRTPHVQRAIFRDEKNMRNVAAVLLVEVTALFGQVHGFALADVLKVDDGVGHAALGSDDQALQIGRLFGLRVADLGVFGDGKLESVRNRPRPFHRTRNGAPVVDRDDFVVAL
jgi:hypothetical protein